MTLLPSFPCRSLANRQWELGASLGKQHWTVLPCSVSICLLLQLLLYSPEVPLAEVLPVVWFFPVVLLLGRMPSASRRFYSWSPSAEPCFKSNFCNRALGSKYRHGKVFDHKIRCTPSAKTKCSSNFGKSFGGLSL